MLEQLKEEVLKANKLLSSEHLAILTWGNVSGFDPEKGLVVIKGSGVEYNIMEPQHLTAVSYTHLRAHETGRNLVCRLLLEKKKKKKQHEKKKNK